MSDETSNDGKPAGNRIHTREIEPDPENANYEVLRVIADVEGVDVSELPPMWERINDAVTELFTDPPSPAAQMEMAFSYHGYRVTMDQSGAVSLKRLDDERLPE